MARGYSKVSSYETGNVISASLFNNDFNKLQNAFTYSSTDPVNTGHTHDGSAENGGAIPKIGDIDFNNKIEIDGTNNLIKLFIEVGGTTSTEILNVSADGLVPTASGIDLGTVANPFDTANITTLTAGTVNSTDVNTANLTATTAVILEDGALLKAGTSGSEELVLGYAESVSSGIISVASGEGNLQLNADEVRLTGGVNEKYLSANLNSGVELYYDNIKTFETVDGGVKVTGTLETTGNVGIGTTSPDYPLDVTGSAQLSGGDLILRSDSDDADTQYIRFENYPSDIRTAYIRADYTSQTAGGGTALAFGANDHATATDTDSMVIDIEGNVGIGTSSPTELLDVKGNVNVTYGTDSLYTTSPLLTSNTFSVEQMADIQYASQLGAVGANPLGSWDNSRRALQILFNFNGTGSASFGGWTASDGLEVSTFVADNYSPSDISTFQSYLQDMITGTYTFQTTIINDILNGNYDYLVDYKVGINAAPATEALDVGGNIKASGFDSSILLSSSLSNNQIISRGSDSATGRDLAFVQGTSESMLIDSSGKVGIGTTSPVSALDVRGDISVGGSGASEAHLGVLRSWSNSSDADIYALMPSGSTISGTIIEGRPNAHVVIGLKDNDNSDSFNVIGTGATYSDTGSTADNAYDRSLLCVLGAGNVGIGTTSPQRELELTGTGNVYARITAPTDDDSAVLELKNTQETWQIRNQDTNDDALEFIDDTATRLTIKKDGNVGIGTASPNHKLHVHNGDVIISSAATSPAEDGGGRPALFFSGESPTTDTDYNDNMAGIVYNGRDLTGNAKYLGLGAWDPTTFASDQITEQKIYRTALNITRGRKVGINTTEPNVDLHVYSTSSPVYSKIECGGNNWTGMLLKNSQGNFRIVADNLGNLRFDDVSQPSNSNRIMLKASGDVDIVQTTTTNKLTVKGYPTFDDLLTTDRTIKELADWTLEITTISTSGSTTGGTTIDSSHNYWNFFGGLDGLINTGDSYKILLFVEDNYTPAELNDYSDYLDGTLTNDSTFVVDVLDGDYDHLGGVVVDKDASNLVTVHGNVHATKVLTPLVNADTVETRDIIVYESQAEAVSPLLTTDRTPEELADLYVAALFNGTLADPLAGIPDYQLPLLNFNGQTSSGDIVTSMDAAAIGTFISDGTNGYSSAEGLAYTTYISASPYVYKSTIVDDIKRGDYDYLLAPAKVGINTETPASALDVIGDISVSGNITSDLGLNFTPANGIEMRAGNVDGIEMHWWAQTTGTTVAADGEQTKRFHITDSGVHVGDDVTGTYTAGDLQDNQDIDYGFLVGRESDNFGSNNVGIGFDLMFDTNSASNFAQGSVIDLHGAATNCVAFGGNLKVGTELQYNTGSENSFIGGVYAATEGDNTFTWAEGALAGPTIYRAINNGKGSVLFGKQGQIDSASTYSLLGGKVGPAPNYIEPSLIDSSYAFSWGYGNVTDSSNGAVVCGSLNSADGADDCLVTGTNNSTLSANSFVAGLNNSVTNVDTGIAIGKDNIVEGDFSVAMGQDNNTLGVAGVCLGRGLKTPLFLNGSNYEWDNYSAVVGAYNDPTEKYYTAADNSTWVDDHRFVVGTGTSAFATDNGFIVAVPTSDFSGVIMPALAASTSHTNDAAAKLAGVPVGGLYHTNGVVKVVL